MRLLLIILGVLLALGVFGWIIIARLPAGYLLDAVITNQSSIVWRDASGTMWHGAARVANGGYDLGTLTWVTEDVSLFPPRWHGHVELSGAEINASSRLSRPLFTDSVTLQSASINAPANWIQHVLNAPFLLLGGELHGDIAKLELTNGRLVALDGNARWVNASIDGRIRTPVGEIQVDFSGDATEIVGDVSDRNGPLTVNGTVRIERDIYTVDLILKAPAEAVELRQALEVLGRVNVNGEVPLQITGPMIDLW